MELKLDADGKCWNGTTEVFELTEAQIDQLCDELYPTDEIVRNQYMTAKRARSHTGSRYGFATLTNLSFEQQELVPCIPDEQVLAIGGRRLLAIYRANCVMSVAAADLKMREDALRRWFHRFKSTDASHELRAIIHEAIDGKQREVLPQNSSAPVSQIAEGTA